MGFLKNYLLHILILMILSNCTKPLIISDAKITQNYFKMFGEDNSRNFYANDYLKDTLKLLWNSSAFGSFTNTSFTAFDKYLFVSDLGGTISCFNINDGKTLGEFKNKGGIYQSPVINQFKLAYVVNQLNEPYSNFVIYDFKFGKQLFNKKLPGKFTNELIFYDKYYFVVSNEGILYKLNLKAEIVFSKNLNIRVISNPTAYENDIIIAGANGELFSVSSENGDVNFNLKISNGFSSGIIVKKNNAFIGDVNGKIYNIDLKNKSIIWEFDTGTKIVSTPALDSTSLYIGNLKGDLFAIDQENGNLKWKVDTKGLINTTPLILNDVVIQPNLKNRVDIFNKTDGSIIQQLKFKFRCKSTPLYYDGKIFFGTERGEVYCYEL